VSVNQKVNVVILMELGIEQEPALMEVLEKDLVREITEKQENVMLAQVSCQNVVAVLGL